MTAFIALDTSVLDEQIEGLIEAINATTLAVREVLAIVQSLAGRMDELEGNGPDEPEVGPPADPPMDPSVEPSFPPLVDENGDALTDELDQVLTEGAADG